MVAYQCMRWSQPNSQWQIGMTSWRRQAARKKRIIVARIPAMSRGWVSIVPVILVASAVMATPPYPIGRGWGEKDATGEEFLAALRVPAGVAPSQSGAQGQSSGHGSWVRDA